MSISFFNGDCLEVMKLLPDKSVDCFICDLPYGCLGAKDVIPKLIGDHRGRTKAMTGCSWDVKINLELFWAQVKRLRKADNSPCLMFATTKFGYELIRSNEKEFRYDLVWDKQRGVSFLTANKMPMRSHEMIYVFSKAGAYYKRVDISGGTPYPAQNQNIYKANTCHVVASSGFSYGLGQLEGKRCMKTVISINNAGQKTAGHPTEKPMALYKFLIERYCRADGTILDPTAGSFNSCFTAYQMGRDAIGIEKDDKFYEKSKKRSESYA